MSRLEMAFVKRRNVLSRRVFVVFACLLACPLFLWQVQERRPTTKSLRMNPKPFSSRVPAQSVDDEPPVEIPRDAIKVDLSKDVALQERQLRLWEGYSEAKFSTSGDERSDDAVDESERSVVILVPYRDRALNWDIFLKFMVEFLAMGDNAGTAFHLVRVEQPGEKLFNRGKLSNLGLFWSMRTLKPDCICVHDVDLLPFPGVSYVDCKDHPWHLTNVFSHLNWESKYEEYFGGAVLMSPTHWIQVNGFSNGYWGWGREDDDLWRRVIREKIWHGESPPHQKVSECINIHFEEFGDKRAPKLDQTGLQRWYEMKFDTIKRHRTEGFNTLKCAFRENKTYQYSRRERLDAPSLKVTEIQVFI